MGAYVDGKPFSVELVAAVNRVVFALFESKAHNHQVVRQSAFTDKIHQLGWLEPAFFESPDNGPVLQYCVLRYYGWVWKPRELLFGI